MSMSVSPSITVSLCGLLCIRTIILHCTEKPHPIIVVYIVISVDIIKPPFEAKILDEPIAIFKNTVYNVSNKSDDCGKNIRWRLLWRLKETFI